MSGIDGRSTCVCATCTTAELLTPDGAYSCICLRCRPERTEIVEQAEFDIARAEWYDNLARDEWFADYGPNLAGYAQEQAAMRREGSSRPFWRLRRLWSRLTHR